MYKYEGKWVYFKIYLPDVINKSLILREQIQIFFLKITHAEKNNMYAFTKIKCSKSEDMSTSGQLWMVPRWQFWMQLQKQHLQIMMGICIA